MVKISMPVLAVSLLVSSVCAEINFDGGKALDIRGEISNMEVPAPAAQGEKCPILDWLFGKPNPNPKPQPPLRVANEWTIMVFINGKNDLEEFALKDINEMEMVGSNSKMKIVVEVGRMAGYDVSDGDWKGARRFLIEKDDDPSKVNSPVIQNLGNVDMGSYSNLAAFGKWAKATYPAKKYMLIVWNHGSGWLKLAKGLNKGISYDKETGNHINTPQLGLALKEIGGVDVYGSDACLMQMAEVVYEIKDYAKYIVGSEETEPGDGYTYNTFLGMVAARPEMSPVELGKAAVNAYSDHYQSLRKESTQSLIKSVFIPRLLSLTNGFTNAVIKAGEKELARSARDNAVQFAITDNKDLYDFVRLVVAGSNNADVKMKGQILMTAISSELVMLSRTNNGLNFLWLEPKDYSLAKGIAAYLPSGSLGTGYTELRWAKYSNWDEFITWLNNPFRH